MTISRPLYILRCLDQSFVGACGRFVAPLVRWNISGSHVGWDLAVVPYVELVELLVVYFQVSQIVCCGLSK